jgi:hypothetical protein
MYVVCLSTGVSDFLVNYPILSFYCLYDLFRLKLKLFFPFQCQETNGIHGKRRDIEYENIEKKNGDIETVTSKNCLKVGNYD